MYKWGVLADDTYRSSDRLPNNFNRLLYRAIEEFQSDRLALNFINARDFMNEEIDYYPDLTWIYPKDPIGLEKDTIDVFIDLESLLITTSYTYIGSENSYSSSNPILLAAHPHSLSTKNVSIR